MTSWSLLRERNDVNNWGAYDTEMRIVDGRKAAWEILEIYHLSLTSEASCGYLLCGPDVIQTGKVIVQIRQPILLNTRLVRILDEALAWMGAADSMPKGHMASGGKALIIQPACVIGEVDEHLCASGVGVRRADRALFRMKCRERAATTPSARKRFGSDALIGI
jgi:hypothetical protein